MYMSQPAQTKIENIKLIELRTHAMIHLNISEHKLITFQQQNRNYKHNNIF